MLAAAVALTEFAPTRMLHGSRVSLLPLESCHRDAVLNAAADGRLWDMVETIVPGPDTIDAYIARALAERDAGRSIPFATSVAGVIVGTTRLCNIDRQHKKLEIGNTFVAKSWQRTFVNSETNLLLLTHVFEDMGFVRVQYSTDERNAVSRKTIVRLGATEEGVVRNDYIMPDGRKRNSIHYSIIDSEWPTARERLRALCSN